MQNEPGIHPGPNCQLSPESRRIMSDCGVGLRLTCVDITPDLYRLPLPCGGYFAQGGDYSGWNHITRALLQVTGMSYRLVGFILQGYRDLSLKFMLRFQVAALIDTSVFISSGKLSCVSLVGHQKLLVAVAVYYRYF